MNIPNLKRQTGEWFDQMRQEMDQILHRFVGSAPGGEHAAGAVWAPRIDVAENPEFLVIKADVPGVESGDIEIAVADGTLMIRGDRKETRDVAERNFHFAERPLGRFYRAVPLPAGADADTIQATCAKGVLTITVPKKPSVQEKKIQIHSME